MNYDTRPHIYGDWQVTYLNQLDGKRHVLIDDIDEVTADKVVDRFGDMFNHREYLPGVRKERSVIGASP